MHASLAAGHRFGPYEVIAPLGAGGMGVVYRARDARLGREVAVKVLPEEFARDPDRLARFEREARAVAALNHPHILVLFDVGQQDGVPYVVTELLEGETLREHLRRGAPTPRKAVEYAVQAALGLAAAHERGVIHRDVKPENLFLTREGRLKILDFGLARQAAAADQADSPTVSHPTDPGTVLGSVGYMSPEQVRGEPLDLRTDIFSLGAVLYELLSGRRAFAAPTPAETLTAILREDPPDLASTSGVPAALERLLRRCLEKRREERLQSARDLALCLEALSEVSTSQTTVPASEPRRSWPRAAAALSLALALALASFVAGRRLSSTDPSMPASFRQLTFRRGTILDARFTPDGQSYLYSAAFDQPGRFKLYAGRVDSPESRVLLESIGRLFAVSSTGEVAVSLRGDTLARLPLAGGAPRELLDGVVWADWSPDGEELAIVRRHGTRQRLEYPVGNVLLEGGSFAGVRVSPGGDAVAFMEDEAAGRSLGLVDRHKRKTTLTRGWNQAFGMAWSGSEVWFTGVREGAAMALHAVSREGHERTVLTAPARLKLYDLSGAGRALLVREDAWGGIVLRRAEEPQQRELSWLGLSTLAGLSRDGRTILFNELREDRPIYLRTTDGAAAVRLGEGRALALSPDARWAMVRGAAGVVLLPTGAGEPRPLPLGRIAEVERGGFFPDGSRAFVVGSEPGSLPRTYVVGLDVDAAPRAVTPAGVAGLAVAPDGRFIAADDHRLYPLEGGEPRSLPGLETGDQIAGWGVDGRSLFVERRTGNRGSMAVIRVDTESGRATLLREESLPDPAGLGYLGDGAITPDGKTHAYAYMRFLCELHLADGLR